MASIKKKIELEVDASKLDKAQQSFSKIEDLTKKILKSLKEENSAMGKIVSSVTALTAARKKENAELEKEKSLVDSISKLEKARQDAYLKTKAVRDLQAQTEQRKLEKGQMSDLEKRQRYRGAAGAFIRAGDEESEKKQEEIDNLEAKILERKQQRESAAAALEKANKTREKARTPEEIARADSDVEARYKDLEAADDAVRQSEKDKSKAIGEQKSIQGKYAALAKEAGQAEDALNKMAATIGKAVMSQISAFVDGVSEATQAILDLKTGAATFSTGTSLITNSAAREQQLKYGLTASQNYGFTQAKGMLGIQSDEDLMYMNASQRDRLLSYMERYSSWYDEMESSGVLDTMQEMQLEIEEMKQEIAMEFIQWLGENKDTIMECLKGMFEFLKGILAAAKAVLSLFGWKSQDLYSPADSSDRLMSNSDNSKHTNITINANTTNNATGVLGSEAALDKFSEENWSKLAKQLVGAIGG